MQEAGRLEMTEEADESDTYESRKGSCISQQLENQRKFHLDKKQESNETSHSKPGQPSCSQLSISNDNGKSNKLPDEITV